MTSSINLISSKTASSFEHGGAERFHEPVERSEPARHVSPVIAHELNNMLTIIQGYTDNLLLLQGKTPALETHLKHIAEAARRASKIIRGASSLPGADAAFDSQ